MCVFHTCIMVHMIVCVQITFTLDDQLNRQMGAKAICGYTMITSPSSTMATTLSHPVIPCNHARSTFRSRLSSETPSCPVFSCRKIISVVECVLLDVYQVVDIAQPPSCPIFSCRKKNVYCWTYTKWQTAWQKVVYQLLMCMLHATLRKNIVVTEIASFWLVIKHYCFARHKKIHYEFA